MDGSFSTGSWREVGLIDDIPPLGARTVSAHGEEIAIFRTGDDRVFALHDRCPHKGGKLSQGIVHGDCVTCPLHGWTICLTDGEAVAPDEGKARSVRVRLDGARIFLELAP